MGMETITLTKKELRRYVAIQHWASGNTTGYKVAATLGLSYRQVIRLKQKLVKEGAEGIIHGNRGRKPAHTLPEATRKTIVELMTGEYHNANDSHFSDLLAEHEEIYVSPSTIRRIRQGENIPPKKMRNSPKAHRSRERRPREGELLQMDGSPHRWLEDRADPFSLVAAIDDATGRIPAAVFRPQEDRTGYYLLTKQIVENWGIPEGAYTDCHTIFRSPKEKQTIEQELAGEAPALSQFGKVLEELGVQHILARSPQAKGRVERLFQTLQDRWTIELRIRGVNTIEEANKCLPELIALHNRRFAVEPAEKELAYVPLESGQNLDLILSYRENRILNRGETIAFRGKTYAVVGNHSIPLKAKVEVRVTLGNELFAIYKGKSYPLREIVQPKRQVTPETKKAGLERRPHKPAVDHPWRRYKPRIAQQAGNV